LAIEYRSLAMMVALAASVVARRTCGWEYVLAGSS
jgi:hypothetical protein